MAIQVGINGFGRIGRIVFRACLYNPALQLAAINDPAISVEYICYLIKFDSTHGKLKGNITHSDHEIVIDDVRIKVFQEKLPTSVPWNSAGVQYVVEASGMFTNQDKASGHLASDGVKRVIVTAPSVDIPMILLGVNGDKLSLDTKVISCASSTLYCLAPIIKVLEDSFGVEEGFLTSIHAMTPSLKPLDGLCLRGRHWRDHRSIHQNIIPATTGACKALGKILPQLKDKLSGLAFRVPIVNVSVLDLTVRLQTETNLQGIVKSVEEASRTNLKNIIKISNDESVSSDFIGESHSCILDQTSSIQLSPNFYKIICWYENEYSYACRVLDTITVSEKQTGESCTKLTGIGQVSSTKLIAVRQCTCSRKEMFNKCSKCRLNSKIVSSTSQDTGIKIKSPGSQPLLIKKPASTTTPPPQIIKNTKRHELFKIWNDISEHSKPNVRQNRCAFFQSCVPYAPLQLPNIECKAQERLENVKKEFSKMVLITEDLLKKTHSNQEKDNIKDSSGDNIEADVSKGDAECNRSLENESSVEEHCDHNNCVDLINSCQSQIDCNLKYGKEPLISYDTRKTANGDNFTVKSSFKARNIAHLGRELKIKTTNRDTTSLKKLDIERYTKKIKIETSNENGEFKQQLTKTSLSAGMSQCIHIQYFCNENKLNSPVEKAEVNKKCEILHKSYSKSSSNSSDKKSTDITEVDNFDKNTSDDKLNKSTNDKSKIEAIQKELRKRNIILVDSSFDEIKFKVNSVKNENDISGLDKMSKYMSVSQQSSQELSYDVAAADSEVNSCCVSRKNTVRFVNGYESKQDIYDKLDSASASDSNNSFEIKERKSQVIQIADLTKSLEDLGRLDKICRIIEISDELSDKLFSALDDGCIGEMRNNRWSFKDLCVRIKLDEFCNKVFGATAM